MQYVIGSVYRHLFIHYRSNVETSQLFEGTVASHFSTVENYSAAAVERNKFCLDLRATYKFIVITAPPH